MAHDLCDCLAVLLAVTLCLAYSAAGLAAESQPQSLRPDARGAHRIKVIVEVEEEIAPGPRSGNGSGALWNAGSPMLVRSGDQVYVSTQEVGGPSDNNICNTRWQLWGRSLRGWKLLQSPLEYREREPCPLARFGDGRLLLSVNPSVQRPGGSTQWMGHPIGSNQRCEPHLLQFDPKDPGHAPSALVPVWPDANTMNDHSYRGLGVDAEAGELFVLNRSGDYGWSFLDSSGRWSNQGRISTEITSCYPLLALRARAAHAVTVGDIYEPNEVWLAYKKEKQGENAFFYVFRRIFYTWNPDIATQQFAPPIEIDSVEQTAGDMWNLDLWLDAKGRAHILYKKKNTIPLMRDKFFPDLPRQESLEYCIVDKGEVVRRSTLYMAQEGDGNHLPVWPNWARFQMTPDGQLFVIAHVYSDAAENRVFENWIAPVMPDGQLGEHTLIPLKYPFARFFNATERGGSLPSYTIDLYGSDWKERSLRYARVRLAPEH